MSFKLGVGEGEGGVGGGGVMLHPPDMYGRIVKKEKSSSCLVAPAPGDRLLLERERTKPSALLLELTLHRLLGDRFL